LGPHVTARVSAIWSKRAFFGFDCHTQPVYGLCMATKTISIETDAYALLAREKKDRTESFSRVIRRLFAERPALTAGELLGVMQEFKGRGAGPRRRRS
jgi:predicted CopG family antitoxin